MADESFVFRPQAARRIPDPNFRKQYNAERHFFTMPVREMPTGLPLDPNARNPNIRKRVYQVVEQSLLNNDGEKNTFHLKNKGITIIAKSVKQRGDHEYLVTMETGLHGIVDGGHTYTLIQNNLENPDLPESQFVTVEVRVGIPERWIPDIAGGLNTSVQVQDMSLDHLAGMFEWMKMALKREPYYKNIAWSENDLGDFDARDIISLMLLFNVELYPNEKDDHPVMGYEKKSLALKAFEDNSKSFERMKPIMKDILRFHDIVRKEARDIWNVETGGKAGSLAFMEKRKKGVFRFPFTGETGEYRLMNGALYPMLASFRWFVVSDPSTLDMVWRESFDAVVTTWRALATELVRATLNASNDLGRNANAIGKSRNHWANMHARVAKHDLMTRHGISA